MLGSLGRRKSGKDACIYLLAYTYFSVNGFNETFSEIILKVKNDIFYENIKSRIFIGFKQFSVFQISSEKTATFQI